MESHANGETIRRIFLRLSAALGPQHWWPADSPFEVVVGAFLTQNTAWTNVELALANLRRAGSLNLPGIRRTPLAELETLVRPAGYFRQKAERIKLFVQHLDTHHGGSLENLFAQPTPALRSELLSLKGIGPETADSILLYSARHEVFVVDTYTRRILSRHGLPAGPDHKNEHPGHKKGPTDRRSPAYDEIRLPVEAALAALSATHRPFAEHSEAAKAPIGRIALPIHQPSPASQLPRSPLARDFSEFHALLVQTAKHFCHKAAPLCQGCPLEPLLPATARPPANAKPHPKSKIR
jgi:endonuclease-3 related protein